MTAADAGNVLRRKILRQSEGTKNMAEQFSKKRGLKSSAQKEQRARNQYDETPASNAVAGAHGDVTPRKASDKDVALTMDERRAKREREAEKNR